MSFSIDVEPQMTRRGCRTIAGALLVVASHAFAGQPFSGNWQIDLRTPAERRAGAQCGNANFKLAQDGHRVTGEHSMATVGCGRLNEGGAGTVEGFASGNTAVLVVTSGRNGEVVRGRATREGANLRWQTIEQLQPGEPEGDSGLILGRGVLRRSSR